MPRTLQEILDDQDRIAAQFETMEPKGESLDGAAHRELLAAAHARGEAEDRVAKAVTAAREAGYSWALIGGALGTSAQAAQQRYRAPAPRPDSTVRRGPTCEVFHASTGWKIKGDAVISHKGSVMVFETKSAAVDEARKLAKSRGGYLVIHKTDGTVQRQVDYTRAS